MRIIMWLIVIAFAVTVAGCKQPTQTAASPSAPTTTAAARKGPAPPPRARPAPGRQRAAAGEYEEVTLTVTIPARPEAVPGDAPQARGGHAGCPMSQSGDILGIRISQPHGIVVGWVSAGGAAGKAGIKTGDSIIACDGKMLSCPASLRPFLISGAEPLKLKLTILRRKAARAAPAPRAGRARA